MNVNFFNTEFPCIQVNCKKGIFLDEIRVSMQKKEKKTWSILVVQLNQIVWQKWSRTYCVQIAIWRKPLKWITVFLLSHRFKIRSFVEKSSHRSKLITNPFCCLLCCNKCLVILLYFEELCSLYSRMNWCLFCVCVFVSKQFMSRKKDILQAAIMCVCLFNDHN